MKERVWKSRRIGLGLGHIRVLLRVARLHLCLHGPTPRMTAVSAAPLQAQPRRISHVRGVELRPYSDEEARAIVRRILVCNRGYFHVDPSEPWRPKLSPDEGSKRGRSERILQPGVDGSPKVVNVAVYGDKRGIGLR